MFQHRGRATLATEQELTQSAVDHAKKTTISWDEFLRRIKVNSSYNYRNTEWYKAGLSLEGIKHLEKPPVPKPPQGAELRVKAQKLIFCAQNPLTCMGASSGHIPCLTADEGGYGSFYNPSVISQLRSKFPVIAAWGVQTQIGAQQIRDFAAKYGLDYCIFQGETDEEYRTAIEAGAQVIVGNPNAWSQASRDDATRRINDGQLALSFETYTNEGAPWPEASSSGGVPAASFCLGIYPAKWNPSAADYKAHTPAAAWPLVSVYHASALSPADWQVLG
jgi:hypothetical protein